MHIIQRTNAQYNNFILTNKYTRQQLNKHVLQQTNAQCNTQTCNTANINKSCKQLSKRENKLDLKETQNITNKYAIHHTNIQYNKQICNTAYKHTI